MEEIKISEYPLLDLTELFFKRIIDLPDQSQSVIEFTNHEGELSFPIQIGMVESMIIKLIVEKMDSKRPLTHDLTIAIMDSVHLKLHKVVIDRFENDIFCSTLICYNEFGPIMIDSRVSDATVLALKLVKPIYIKNNVLEEANKR